MYVLPPIHITLRLYMDVSRHIILSRYIHTSKVAQPNSSSCHRNDNIYSSHWQCKTSRCLHAELHAKPIHDEPPLKLDDWISILARAPTPWSWQAAALLLSDQADELWSQRLKEEDAIVRDVHTAMPAHQQERASHPLIKTYEWKFTSSLAMPDQTQARQN
jgi:hypothetical protein